MNKKAVEILKASVGDWNRWRGKNDESKEEDRKPDLSEVELFAANLCDANLRSINLSRADLSHANLSNADLQHADLSKVNLQGTRLKGADLTYAHLTEANLRQADLRNAKLGYVDFSGADLSRADLTQATLVRAYLVDTNLVGTVLADAYLSEAEFEGTVIGDIDLSNTMGLESVNHYGPSIIGTRTLELSKGNIPATFLRGCGLSDWEIEVAKLYSPNLNEDELTFIHYELIRIKGEQPIMTSRIFISYSHADADFVGALEPLLDEKGVRYWRDAHDMLAGRMETQIDRGITLNPLVLLILSENSVESDWVEYEATTARELEQAYRKQGQPRDVLCPVALDGAWKDSAWPRALRRQIEDYLILDFSGWRDPDVMAEQFRRLYEGIVLNYPAAPP